jgi:hypothetical protein
MCKPRKEWLTFVWEKGGKGGDEDHIYIYIFFYLRNKT